MLKRVVNVLIISTIFVSSITFFSEPFEFHFSYIIFLICSPVLIFELKGVHKFILYFLVFELLIGGVNIILGYNSISQFFKIFFGLSLSTAFYYLFLKYNDFNIQKVFKLYLKGAYLISLIGVIQFASYKVGFSFGYDYSWILNKYRVIDTMDGRVNSILPEPAHLVQVLSPAMFVALYRVIFFKGKYYSFFQSLVILFTFFMAKSSTGYIGVLLVIALISFNYLKFKNIIVFAIIGILAFTALMRMDEGFEWRVESVVKLVDSGEKAKGVDLSTFALYSNLHVSYQNLKRHPLFGTGLGSHFHAYEKYRPYDTGIFKHFKEWELNKDDANSLFLRLMSEQGLFGLLLSIVFLVKYYIRRDVSDLNGNWIISNALLLIMMLYLLRMGHYFMNGFVLFVWSYYYLHKTRHVIN